MKKHIFFDSDSKKSIIYLALLTAFFWVSCNPAPDIHPEYGWFDFVVKDLDTTRNEIDLSFLNEDEAGQGGFVSVRDGHFVDGSGNRIRFFGTNLTFSSCFPEKETAVLIAARLEKMGMNVVRFHHMDMREAPDGLWDDSMEHFDQSQLDRLDWLIYQLKMHGIYTNLNLHVSRTYPGLETDVPQFRFGKSLDHFYKPYIEFQKKYAQDLLSHRNPYTGKTYLEEPAIAFIEINNENSLLSNWRQLALLNGDLRSSLKQQWNAWIAANASGKPVKDIFSIIDGYDDKTSVEQKRLFWSFMIDTEMAYAEDLIGFVRNDLKARSLIADSQASYSGIAGIFREASFSDFIDMHAYWEHPRFPNESWSSTDWLIRNSSMVSDKNAGTLARFGQHRVKGMPLTISEYDHPAPNFFCAEMYPMLNSVAAYQDWDGIYHFTFNGPWDKGRISGFFSSAGHPLKQIFIPVGSAIFRMDGVNPGTHYVRLNLSENKVIDELVNSGHMLRLHGSNMDHVWEQAGAPKALSLLHPFEVNTGASETGLSEQVIDPGPVWESETGALIWEHADSVNNVFKINTASVKAAIGYIGGKEIELGNVRFAIDSIPSNWACVVLTALDGNPIEISSSVLMVAAGRVENTNMGWNKDFTSVGSDWGNHPTKAEGIPGRIYMDQMDRFSVYVLDPEGNRGNELPVISRKGQRSFSIGAQYKTLWYILKR